MALVVCREVPLFSVRFVVVVVVFLHLVAMMSTGGPGSAVFPGGSFSHEHRRSPRLQERGGGHPSADDATTPAPSGNQPSARLIAGRAVTTTAALILK